MMMPLLKSLVSIWNPSGEAVGAVRGFSPETYPTDPYPLDDPGLIPTGLVLAIEGRKGEQGKEWGAPSLESYGEMDPECEKRTLDFIQQNARVRNPSLLNTGRIS